jgi:hypothetical protein
MWDDVEIGIVNLSPLILMLVHRYLLNVLGLSQWGFFRWYPRYFAYVALY